MAQKTYIGVDNTAQEVTKIYYGINNVAKQIKKVYIGVNGTAKLVYGGSSGRNPIVGQAVVGEAVID